MDAELKLRPERRPFVQKTYALGSDQTDLTKALALVDELEDAEVIREMQEFEERRLA